MMHWLPQLADRDGLEVLCLGAHCDDIEIGCGGTLVQLAKRWPASIFRCVVFSSTDVRKKESESALNRLLSGRNVAVEFHSFRNSFFPYIGAEIKQAFESLKSVASPDLILTHARDDRHQDHRLLSDLSWNTFRDHTILEYEIPKYDGDLGRPNCYVPLEHGVVEAKIACLMECFATQSGRAWFTEQTFRGLMRLRGMECNAASGYAEAFVLRKAVISTQ